MITQRQIFFENLAQTSDLPMALEIVKANGVYLYDASGRIYFDLISGISVSNIGHRHPKVIEAVKKQLDDYMHLMVYGEYIQSPQVNFARLLTEHLPAKLSNVYFVNSGSEAVEGALKLAKRFTGKTEIIGFKNAYHGSTHGALSVGGNEELKNSFRPLLPGIKILEYNSSELSQITGHTACVIVEPIQGEAGIILPEKNFLRELRKRCDETGTLLIFDEIQTAFGRTGKLFAFEHDGVIPDILLLGKALGGGMPLGAFISSKELMQTLTEKPVLGHITTFGGHPVCCTSGLASLQVLLDENLVEQVERKEELFRKNLQHPFIKNIRGKGLFLALEFESEELNRKIVSTCIEKGVVVDWFLFAPNCMRIAPPLTITETQVETACKLILKSINQLT
ncbi:MAG: aspartate aminotransferase family protein [Bacteroidetes bacterium]|nr:aspartate aminotransferase family protein [Bacteroidota bacterium]